MQLSAHVTILSVQISAECKISQMQIRVNVFVRKYILKNNLRN